MLQAVDAQLTPPRSASPSPSLSPSLSHYHTATTAAPAALSGVPGSSMPHIDDDDDADDDDADVDDADDDDNRPAVGCFSATASGGDGNRNAQHRHRGWRPKGPAPPPLTITPPPQRRDPGTAVQHQRHHRSASPTTSDPQLHPRARHVVDVFCARAKNDGRHSIAAHHIPISRALVDQALKHIEQLHPRVWLYIQAKEHWEYWEGQLHLRMSPSGLHEILVSQVARGIDKHVAHAIAQAQARVREQSSSTADGDGSTEVADRLRRLASAQRVWDSIRGSGGARISSWPRGDEHWSPDASWLHPGSSTAPFVLEVAWSQQTESLQDKAENYILTTKGLVRTVLTLDPTYQATSVVESPPTTVSFYRYCLEGRTFRADVVVDAVPTPSASISLRLADFIPYSLVLEDPELTSIDDAIGDIELDSAFFVDAVENAWASHRQHGIEVSLPETMAAAQPQKRKRAEPSPSPPPRSADTSFDGEASVDKPYVPTKRLRTTTSGQGMDTYDIPRRSTRARSSNS